MTGELDLSVLMSSMKPILHPDVYVFCTLADDAVRKLAVPFVMQFREREGTTVILTKNDAQKAGIDFVYPSKMITLNIHSSLEAIGFLAEIAKHLAAAGISVNAVSAFHHDHIFVPLEKAEVAVRLLENLSHAKRSFAFNDLVPELGVSNLGRSLEFYTEILPFQVEYGRAETGFAFLSLGGSQLMLEQLSATTTATEEEFRQGQWRTGLLEKPFGRGINISIKTDSVGRIKARLTEAGYPIKLERGEIWYRKEDVLVGESQILVMDPDGYLLRFQESLGTKPAPSLQRDVP